VMLESSDAECAYARLLGADAPPIDVLVVDLELQGCSGLELTRRVCRRWPALRVLIFTMHDDGATASQCLRAGAAGFVTKCSAPELLVAALRDVATGEQAVSPDVSARLRRASAQPHSTLSTREFDVLNALLEGLGLDAIARRLSLSEKTVANYQSSIRQKLGVGNSRELWRYAHQQGLGR
jgi:DNA-binding NarL/FixJ family response regulator